MRTRIENILDNLRPGRIIAAAVIARLVFGLFWMLAVNVPSENVPVAGDTRQKAGADGYLQIARTLIVSGEYAFEPGGPPVHNRPPVQVLLMLVFGAWLPSHWYIVWMFGSALLSLLMLVGLHRLAKDSGISPRRQHLLLLLVGFHPYLIFISKTSTFINIAALLLVLVALLCFRISRRPLRYAPLTGLVMGIGALTHGTFLLLPFLSAPYIFSRKHLSLRQRLMASLLVVLTTAAVVAPWTIRNYRTFDRVIPVVTGNGYHYWKGDAVYFGGDYPMADMYFKATGKVFEEKYFGAVDPAADAVLWELARTDIVSRPGRIPLRLIIGTATFFAPWDSSYAKAAVSAALNVPLLLFLFYFLLRRWRQRSFTAEQISIGLLLLYIVEAYAFFVSWGSYFTMLLPLMLFLLVSLAEPVSKPASASIRRSQETR